MPVSGQLVMGQGGARASKQAGGKPSGGTTRGKCPQERQPQSCSDLNCRFVGPSQEAVIQHTLDFLKLLRHKIAIVITSVCIKG